MEQRWPLWNAQNIWSGQMVKDIHQDLFARLSDTDRLMAEGDVLKPGVLRDREVSVGSHAAPQAQALPLFLDQVRFMATLLGLDSMKERIAACLGFEENVVRQGVRTEALRALHYLFATQGELDRADFKAMLGLGDRQATAQVSALLSRGLLVTDSPYGKLRFGVPQHALRFYFPGLWPEAEGGA